MDLLSPLPAGKRLAAHPSLLCPRKAAAQCTHSGWSPLWCRAKSCDQAICPLHVTVPASEQVFNDPPPPQWALCPWRGKVHFQMYFRGKYIFKCTLAGGAISSSATQTIPSLQHIVEPYPPLSPTFSFFPWLHSVTMAPSPP